MRDIVAGVAYALIAIAFMVSILLVADSPDVLDGLIKRANQTSCQVDPE